MNDFEQLAFRNTRIIDFHMHYVDGLLSVMNNYNIERSVVIPFNFKNYNQEKLYTISLQKEKPADYISIVLKNLGMINEEFLSNVGRESRLIPAPWISPESNNDDVMNSDVKLVKIIPSLDNVTIDYFDRLIPLVKQAVSNHKIVMIHTGWNSSPKLVGDLASKFKEGTFVIAHAKEDDDSYKFDRLKTLLENKNTYLETSYFQLPKRISDFERQGLLDRLLFGSDYMGKGYEKNISAQVIGIKLALNEEEAGKVLYNNSKKLLENL